MSINIKPGVKLGPGVSVTVPVDPTPPHTLTVTQDGTGNGLVISNPSGINGPGEATFEYGTEVVLSAMAAQGSQFTGWGGSANGTGQAFFTMTEDYTVSATFTQIRTLVSIVITPSSGQVPAGYTQQLTATGLYSNGDSADITLAVAWSSTDENVATVDNYGLLSGVGVGSTSIRASLGIVTGTRTATINDSVLVAITISPPNPTVVRGGTIQLTASGMFSDGEPFDLTKQVTWSSTHTNVATVDINGLVTGVAGGSTAIHANINGVDGQVTLFAGN